MSSVGMRVVLVDRGFRDSRPTSSEALRAHREHHAFGNEQLATVVAPIHPRLALFEHPAQQPANRVQRLI
jgi:hypothetical protein